jgi:hypothetical protein
MPKPPRFDASSILERGRASDAYYEPVDASTVDEEDIYHGRKVRWVGTPGYMIRIPASRVFPMPENMWFPNQLARYVKAIKEGDLLEAPAARVFVIDQGSILGSLEQVEAGEIEYPFDESDVGQPYVVLLDGNHRAFAAILSGEPYIWAYVGENYREAAKPWME